MDFSVEKRGRPRIKLPFNTTELILEFVAAVSLIFMLGVLIYWWSSIPEVVPKHFGITGEIDAWGNKKLLPVLYLLTVFIYVSISVLNWFPHIYNYPVNITAENAERQYRNARISIIAMKAGIVLCFTYIQWNMIFRTSLGPLFIPTIIIITLGLLGYFIYHAYNLK